MRWTAADLEGIAKSPGELRHSSGFRCCHDLGIEKRSATDRRLPGSPDPSVLLVLPCSIEPLRKRFPEYPGSATHPREERFPSWTGGRVGGERSFRGCGDSGPLVRNMRASTRRLKLIFAGDRKESERIRQVCMRASGAVDPSRWRRVVRKA